MSDLSVVELTRIREYQRAVERSRAEEIQLGYVTDETRERTADGREKLEELGIDPELALALKIKDREIMGDR